MNHARDMAAFDAMPAAVRRALACSAFDFPSAQIARDVRRFRLDERQTLAFVAELERWARAAASRATGTNRREATCPVGALVARARAAAGAGGECGAADSV